MQLDYWEKQLILYTKGHFKRINYDKDLKHFPANYYGLSLEQVQQYNIIDMVCRVYEKLCDNGNINFKLSSFLTDIFKRGFRKRGDGQTSWDDVVEEMLAEIQNIRVKDTGLNLGSPNPELLGRLQ